MQVEVIRVPSFAHTLTHDTNAANDDIEPNETSSHRPIIIAVGNVSRALCVQTDTGHIVQVRCGQLISDG